MEPKILLNILTFVVPAVSNLICCAITFLDILITPVQRERKLKIWLVAFFFADFIVWINLLFQSYYPAIFHYTHPVWYLGVLLVPVLMYMCIRILAFNMKFRTPLNLHFILPVLLVAVTAVKAHETIPTSHGGKELFNFELVFELLYSFVYMFLCLWVIFRSRRKLRLQEPNPNLERMINWMTLLLPFCVVVLLLPSEVILIAGESLPRTIALFIWVLLLVGIHILMCINIIKRKHPLSVEMIKSAPIDLTEPEDNLPAPESPAQRYLAAKSEAIMEIHAEPDAEPQDEESELEECTYEKFTKKLNKRSFDAWFSRNKPYLDPELKMENLLGCFELNRTQFSNFINQNYGMSFVNYVGMWRLRELDRLKNMPRNRTETLNHLLSQAGFGSHKSYRRAQDFHANFTEK